LKLLRDMQFQLRHPATEVGFSSIHHIVVRRTYRDSRSPSIVTTYTRIKRPPSSLFRQIATPESRLTALCVGTLLMGLSCGCSGVHAAETRASTTRKEKDILCANIF
jgi:hypothetical protein